MVVANQRERRRAQTIIQRLEKTIPEAKTALDHKTPFQLLIATILSAQCTDVRVNQVTPLLFASFPGPREIIQGDSELLISIIRPTGFYKNKAKNIIGCAKKLLEDFKGVVPETMETLITFPGVGRKTANVVLGSVFSQQTIVVDTHVIRVSNRLGLSKSSNPEKIEADLCSLLKKENWTLGSHRLLLHGRHTCKARKPLCEKCTLFDLCKAEIKSGVDHQ